MELQEVDIEEATQLTQVPAVYTSIPAPASDSPGGSQVAHNRCGLGQGARGDLRQDQGLCSKETQADIVGPKRARSCHPKGSDYPRGGSRLLTKLSGEGGKENTVM